MGQFQGRQQVQRFLPGGFGLSGESGDQVHAEVGDAGGAQPGDGFQSRGAGVQAAAQLQFAVDEGLYAQAGAVHACLEQRL